MTEQQAMNWYWADLKEQAPILDARAPKELRPETPSWFELTEARRDHIRARVRHVLEGEIPRSQMGPADLAIYFGRYRTVETSPPESFLQMIAEADRRNGDEPARDIRRGLWWDCLEMRASPRTQPATRLFGNSNVGNLNLTNLQIAGQLGHGQYAHLNSWHLTLGEDDDNLPRVEQLLANAVATLIIGDMPQARRRMVELWREPQPLSSQIPSRQCFNVRVEFFGEVFSQFQEYLHRREHRDIERNPFRLWIHLEGWEARQVW